MSHNLAAIKSRAARLGEHVNRFGARNPDGSIGMALLVGAFFLYWRTMPPTILDGDSSEYQYMAYILGVPHSSGYPLYILIAKLFTFIPLGDIAYRVNLVSVVAAALTAPLVYLVARQLRLPSWSAIFVASLFIVTPSMWGGAVQAKTYALHLLLGVLTIHLALRWHQQGRRRDFLAAAFVYGLSLTNHHVIVFLAPALGLIAWLNRARLDRSLLARAIILLLIPLSLYAYIPIRAHHFVAQQDPQNWELYPREDAMLKGTVTAYYNHTPQGFFLLITGLDNYFKFGFRSGEEQVSRLSGALNLLLEQFTAVGLALGVWGAIVSFQRDRQMFAFLAAIAAGIGAIAVGVRAISTVYYFSLFYFALAIWIGFAADALLKRLGKTSGNLLPARQPRILVTLGILAILPINNLLTYYARFDRSEDNSARRHAETILQDNLAHNAVVVAPWEIVNAIRYLQFVENRRPDLLVVNVSPIWPQFDRMLTRARELGRAFYSVEFAPEFKTPNGFRTIQAVPLNLRQDPQPKYPLSQKSILNEVEVIGFDLEPDPPQPGHPARVLVYYRVRARMYPMYSSLLSVNDLLGRPIGDYPSFPSSFYYPTYRWRIGEVYRDTYAFVIPLDSPAGLYTLDLYWYPYDLERRSPDQSKEHAMALGTIRVGDFGPPQSVAFVQSARVGDSITFLGWDAKPAPNTDAISISRGQSLQLDLYWRADKPIDVSYTVFVHLVDFDGRVVANVDSPPLSGLYPTDRWGQEEVLSDRRRLPIPANLMPGRYSLVIGMYSPTSGVRLPIVARTLASDRIILTQVNVR